MNQSLSHQTLTSQMLSRYPRTALARALALALGGGLLSMPAFATTLSPFTVQASSDVDYFGPTAVARNATGVFVVGWLEGNGAQAHVRLYNADGSVKADAVLPPFNTAYLTGRLGLAIDAAGEFVVAWTDTATSTGGKSPARSVLAQRFDANAVVQGNPIHVGSLSTGNGQTVITSSTDPQVAMDDQGDFSVAWSTDTQTLLWETARFTIAGESAATYAATYQQDGQSLTSARKLDSVPFRLVRTDGYSLNTEALAKLAMNGNGDLLLMVNIQTQAPNSGIKQQVSAQRFNMALKAQGGRSILSGLNRADDASLNSSDQIAVIAENFAPTATQTTWSLSLYRYAADTTPLGAPATLETALVPSSVLYLNPALAMTSSGDFAITWTFPTTLEGGGIAFSKQGQYFHADGSAKGSAFIIDSGTAHQNWPQACATDAQGNLIVTWGSNTTDFANPAVLGSLITP